MGSSAVQIGCVAFGVLGLILVTVCCAIASWVVVEPNIESHAGPFPGPFPGPMNIQVGLWKVCVEMSGFQVCMNYEGLPGLTPDLLTTRAMTVISCLLTYFGFLILLILGFCPNLITSLQNEDTKPKVRLVVGVGLLLAGLLMIIPLCWFPHIIDQGLKALMPPNSFPESVSITTSKGAAIYVGGATSGLLLLGGSLLCCFRRCDIP